MGIKVYLWEKNWSQKAIEIIIKKEVITMKAILTALSLMIWFDTSNSLANSSLRILFDNQAYAFGEIKTREQTESVESKISQLQSAPQVMANLFSGNYKILCPGNPLGCACFGKEGEIKTRFFHALPVPGVSSQDESKGNGDFIAVKDSEKQTCFFPRKDLQPIYWSSDRCLSESDRDAFQFASLTEILPRGSDISMKRSVSKIFPTFYTIATESLHDGPKVEKLFESGTNRLIATVNKAFREDLDLEGTGQLTDGRVINVGKYSPKTGWDYLVLPDNTFGYGVAGHFLYPFRSAAVDFEWLCQAAKLGDCSGGRQAVTARYAGQLLYFPKLNGLPLPNGQNHDGYICAKDIGGAIVSDRIDLFVGPTGGGNPYLKECLFTNAFIEGGISSLTPWDWREFREIEPLPDGTRKFKRTNPTEYRTISPQKGLEFSIVPNVKCLKSW